MADGFIHTFFSAGQWVNEVAGGGEFGGGFANKQEAVAAGRGRAPSNTGRNT